MCHSDRKLICFPLCLSLLYHTQQRPKQCEAIRAGIASILDPPLGYRPDSAQVIVPAATLPPPQSLARALWSPESLADRLLRASVDSNIAST